MRVEPYAVGSYLHIIKRGARGLPIVRDEADHWRFLRMLYLLNDRHFDKHWIYTLTNESKKRLFYRPSHWPERKQIVDILAYTLMPNHFHLLVREKKDGGVSLFMQRLGQSMTNHSNLKYEESGSIFQGSFRSRTIDTDEYLRYVSAYIMVKNTFELYPAGGLVKAQENFETAWGWAVTYPFSSLGDYAAVRNTSPIITKNILKEVFDPESFNKFSRDVIAGGKWETDKQNLEF